MDGSLTAASSTVNHSQERAVTQFGSGADAQLPAPSAGGLYKTNCNQRGRFCRGLSVPVTANRVFRGGEGTFHFHLIHIQTRMNHFGACFARAGGAGLDTAGLVCRTPAITRPAASYADSAWEPPQSTRSEVVSIALQDPPKAGARPWSPPAPRARSRTANTSEPSLLHQLASRSEFASPPGGTVLRCVDCRRHVGLPGAGSAE